MYNTFKWPKMRTKLKIADSVLDLGQLVVRPLM